jgi:putative acetyltransferase
MQIEQPQEKDYSELTALWEASVRATHDFLSEEDILFFKPLVREQYLKMVTLYCTKDERGRITGFIGIADRKVEMLFIDPALRGQGIGKELLTFATTQKQVTAVDVNEQNSQGVGFYLHQGFTIAGRSETDGMGKPFPILHLEKK